MKYISTKTIDWQGGRLQFTAKFQLDDECHNGVCHFSITGKAVCVDRKSGYKTGEQVWGGCCHEQIAKSFPELIPFIPLHLSNEFGQPSYPVDNFIFHINQRKGKGWLCREYRVTEEQLEILSGVAIDKELFQYHLFKLGVIDQWKAEAEKAIAWLEEKTGQRFTHTKKPRFTLTADEEWMKTMEGRIESGELTVEGILQKKQAERVFQKAREIARLKAECEEACRDARSRYEIRVWIIENIPTDNYTFTPSWDKSSGKLTYKLELNACNWGSRITEEEYAKILADTKIPEDLVISLKKQEA